MSTVQKRTFSIPAEQAAFIDQKISSGRYSSASEVVRAGLRALQERDDAVERWLREDVTQTYDAMVSDPGRAVDANAVFDELRRRHATRTKGGA